MTIDYTGQVKLIKKNANDKIVSECIFHNKGTNNLFRFIVNCLLGNLDTKALPSYIDLRYRYDIEDVKSKETITAVSSITTNNGTPILSSNINEVEYNGQSYLSVQLTASFSAYDFIDPSIFQFDGKEVYLTVTGNDKTIELTELPISEEDFANITQLEDDQHVSIEWTMFIKNSDEGGVA